MFSLQRPSDSFIRDFLAVQSRLPYSYPEVGSTRGAAPAGYHTNHHRVRLGSGAQAFADACDDLRRWTMFGLPWVTLCFPDAPIEPGTTVGILARRLGLWTLNACRIVETIAEDGPLARFGFRYGTLPDHVERGEEQFVVEWDRADDSVWYDVLSHSTAGHWTARYGRPVVKHFQRQFARGSLEAMKRAATKPLGVR